jgi:hypothetical protein
LFPFIRFMQLRGDFRRLALREPIWFLMPMVFAMLGGIAIGEFVGYLGGPGGSNQWLLQHEMRLFERANATDRGRFNAMMQAASGND